MVDTLKRLHWITETPDDFYLHTDHINLIFIFDPLTVIPDLSISTVRKVLRWEVRLSLYNYVSILIPDDENVWDDLLGSWAPPTIIRHLVKIATLPTKSSEYFVRPTLDHIHDARKSTDARALKTYTILTDFGQQYEMPYGPRMIRTSCNCASAL